jgi:hypothetical protein
MCASIQACVPLRVAAEVSLGIDCGTCSFSLTALGPISEYNNLAGTQIQVWKNGEELHEKMSQKFMKFIIIVYKMRIFLDIC